jgi:FtsH-binding integral membrane protein
MKNYTYTSLETATTEQSSSLTNFNTDPVHASLISKTYGLLSLQTLITTLVVIPMYINKPYVLSHKANFFFYSTILCFLMLFAMFFTNGKLKLLMSLLFSCANGLMIGSAIIQYNANILFHATVITLSTTFFISAIVHYFNMNLHHWKGLLIVGLWTIILTSFVFLFFPVGGLALTFQCVAGIILFIGWLMYDTSMLRHTSYVYDEDQYIIMATGIYLDIINLFLYILRLLARQNNRYN